MSETLYHYVDGARVAGTSGRFGDVYDPATGAVAAGDDLIETVTGGHLFSKLSRRFGEGVVNGALTARVGIAAMEVCRPLPFIAQPRPSVSNLVSRGLAGLFGSDSSAASAPPPDPDAGR